MKPIIILMFCVQAGILLVTIYTVAIRRPTVARPGPIWSSLAISLFVVGMVSNEIAQSHLARPGADILSFTGGMLIGMAIMAALLLFRQRRVGA
jgi:hypothetical protein